MRERQWTCFKAFKMNLFKQSTPKYSDADAFNIFITLFFAHKF